MPSLHKLNSFLIAVDRNLPWPVWKRVLRLAPRRCQGGAHHFLCVIRPKDFWMCLWSVYSWVSHLSEQHNVHIVVDGPMQQEFLSATEYLLPGAEVITAASLFTINPAATKGWEGFLAHHPFARKLAALLYFQAKGDVLYSDSDILVFKRPEEIEDWFIGQKHLFYLPESFDNTSMDEWVVQRLGLVPNLRFNAGLLGVIKGTLEVAGVQGLFDDWTVSKMDWTTEQCLLGALLTSRGSVPLPLDRYLMTTDGFYLWDSNLDLSNAVLRHYAGPVRHRFRMEGIPRLVKSLSTRKNDDTAVT